MTTNIIRTSGEIIELELEHAQRLAGTGLLEHTITLGNGEEIEVGFEKIYGEYTCVYVEKRLK